MFVSYAKIHGHTFARKHMTRHYACMYRPSRTFGMCDTSSLQKLSSRILFAGDGVVFLPIQENDPSCDDTLCNIKAVCEIMTDGSKGSEVS